ncbi:hypothetical protein EVAR_53146_1 [Eumeta japonica]|uniref:Uncharacterized protein n=1 Tax=Eumeta variegata TaxID=151549 RepID=A0A4C1YAK8_EUMVA|nr:hypothetical protein EVAR_53146_1 [Eumeta japonica]
MRLKVVTLFITFAYCETTARGRVITTSARNKGMFRERLVYHTRRRVSSRRESNVVPAHAHAGAGTHARLCRAAKGVALDESKLRHGSASYHRAECAASARSMLDGSFQRISKKTQSGYRTLNVYPDVCGSKINLRIPKKTEQYCLLNKIALCNE